MDLIGPFPETPLFGHRYALAVYEFFNSYLEAILIRGKRSETVARALVTGYITLGRRPRRLHSSQGSEFTGPMVQEMAKMLSVGQRCSSSYSVANF